MYILKRLPRISTCILTTAVYVFSARNIAFEITMNLELTFNISLIGIRDILTILHSGICMDKIIKLLKQN